VESNSGLFNYRQVKPLDAAVARLVLEAVIHLLALAVLLLGAVYLGYAVPVHDPLAALGALGLLAGLGAGLGLIACVVACRFEESKKIIPVLMRPLYFLSGIFFPLDAIPAQFQPYLLWNPILHGIELFRGSIVVVDAEIHGDFTYLGIAALVVIYAGLALFRRDRFEMVAS
jgi:capsular polysaccharide transport system permease protein